MMFDASVEVADTLASEVVGEAVRALKDHRYSQLLEAYAAKDFSRVGHGTPGHNARLPEERLGRQSCSKAMPGKARRHIADVRPRVRVLAQDV
jgi:hypothetical protein